MVHMTDSTGMLHSKCRPRSLSDRRQCCPQSLSRANPTPATLPFATCQSELVPGLRAPDLDVKDFDTGLDGQKFAFAVWNSW